MARQNDAAHERSKGATALDVCCGTGDWTIALADAAGETGKSRALISAKHAEHRRTKTESYSQIELIHGNAMELPFPDNTFDYVTIGFGLRNVPDYLTVLKRWRAW